MTRYTLHVPEQFNDGREIPGYLLDEIELDLAERFGGYTRTSATGGWRADDGTIHIEPMQLYIVDSAAPGTAGRLSVLAERLARDLKQDAIYLTEQEIQTYLVTAREEIAS
jgi:hypothetical protein